MRAPLAWLAAGVWLASAAAQQPKSLDLSLPSTDSGVVRAIREVHLADPAAPPSLKGLPLVGAVAYLPIGRGVSGDEQWQFGAAGTAEMQAQLAQNSYQIDVLMDDGERRTFPRRQRADLAVGDQVTVRSGELVRACREGSTCVQARP
jgi:hypothetical protein